MNHTTLAQAIPTMQSIQTITCIIARIWGHQVAATNVYKWSHINVRRMLVNLNPINNFYYDTSLGKFKSRVTMVTKKPNVCDHAINTTELLHNITHGCNERWDYFFWQTTWPISTTNTEVNITSSNVFIFDNYVLCCMQCRGITVSCYTVM